MKTFKLETSPHVLAWLDEKSSNPQRGRITTDLVSIPKKELRNLYEDHIAMREKLESLGYKMDSPLVRHRVRFKEHHIFDKFYDVDEPPAPKKKRSRL